MTFGTELGTGYSELVDPVEQRERLTAQSLLAAGGDPEAMQLDEDFLRALEYGMPPTGGMGMGIDRLMIMLTGETIRETILFPFVRPDVGPLVAGPLTGAGASSQMPDDPDRAGVGVHGDRLDLTSWPAVGRVDHRPLPM